MTKEVERTPLNLPDPDPFQGREVEWVVITSENAQEIWAELEKNNTDMVLFGLTDEGYESLALNMAEIRNIINEYRIILVKYKEYYETTKDPAAE